MCNLVKTYKKCVLIFFHVQLKFSFAANPSGVNFTIVLRAAFMRSGPNLKKALGAYLGA